MSDQILEEAFLQPGVTNSVASLFNAVKHKGYTRKQVEAFLADKETAQVAQKVTKHYGGTVIALTKGTFELDLADMSKLKKDNNGISWFLVAIDSLTKFAHVLPMKNKTAGVVNDTFSDFIKEHNVTSIVADPGSEFTNNTFKKILKDNNISIRYTRVGYHAPNA